MSTTLARTRQSPTAAPRRRGHLSSDSRRIPCDGAAYRGGSTGDDDGCPVRGRVKSRPGDGPVVELPLVIYGIAASHREPSS
jgi:hypothetical protein